MASKLWISEYERPQNSPTFPMQAGYEDGNTNGVDQTPVDYSGGATQSAAFATGTKFVRVHTDSICSIKFGASPTATTANKRMAAGQTEYFGVVGGQKLSVIINT